MIKSTILGCFFYFAVMQSAFSQKQFSYDELVKLTNCADVSCFDKTVTVNGYSFAKTVELPSGAGIMTMYTADKLEQDGKANQTSILIFNEKGGNAKSVGFRTTNKSYYLRVKNLLAERNYVLVKTVNATEKTMRYYYRKGNYGLQITIDRLEAQSGMVTSYDFNILNPANQYWPGI